MQKRFYVYIMTNKYNRVLYTGVTHDIAGRIWQHKQGEIEGFTKRYRLHKLVHFEEFAYVEDAILREKKIKGWLRARKIALVESGNQEWLDLAEDWYDEE
ncbi:GIY-YIG nuclease family protein [Chloroflexota bacterium]